ncbi:MAG TPA: hypothetical protein VFT91_09125 [Dehalococcoidia bacterium]|nr:hypothetical protein [Dehalococcoidia bacterium]
MMLPPTGRWRALALATALVAVALSVFGTLALFTDTFVNGGNAFSTDTLDAPASVSAAPGAPAPRVEVSWTATADTYAAGYRVRRATTSGGPYSPIAEVTPRTATTYTDTTVTGGTTYYYVVRSFYQSWQSADSNEASATP